MAASSGPLRLPASVASPSSETPRALLKSLLLSDNGEQQEQQMASDDVDLKPGTFIHYLSSSLQLPQVVIINMLIL